MTEELAVIFLASTVRLAMPILLAALGELVSERAGVLNLSLEGIMLSAAFAAVVAAHATGSPVIGLVAALATGALCGLFQAWLSVTVQADQIVTGLGFNILAFGLTTLFNRELFGLRSALEVPGIEKVAVPLLVDIPLIGPALFNQTWLVYLGLLSVPAMYWMLRNTSFGLAVEAAGTDPLAGDKTGVSIVATRYRAVVIAGAFAGAGGAFISIGDIHTFTEGMTNGIGFIALAAVIFGNWRVWWVLGASLVFGFATAMQFQLPAMGVDAPVALLVMLPYVLALLAVAGVVGRQSAPPALTLPFRRMN
ncbi:MAG: ABC transporter permease [Minwuia sp.]|uniref:ABC transporter permease n=1 Tax=Minwuia sp. TaxID=2493630 RepID=UPI003A881DCC